ncbi:MAG: tripartite tricarboxylate transporter substrate binding protein [Betaproteobacteria bacterium]|nr:tripartite tricarboxylate transporter substrate binding protein [Betaproteobacteria bacterium]
MKTLRLLAYGSCALFSTPFAQGQNFPSQTIRFIVPAIAGAPSDTLPRSLIEPLGKALGQSIVVENRVGGDGVIGAEACVKASPDGHTICSSGNSMMSLNPVIRAKLPYDPVKDVSGVVFSGYFDSVLAVHPSVPANNVTQLVELARANPNKVNWGHFGLNTTGNFYQLWLRKSRGGEFFPVPYKTTTQALQAILAGEVQVAVYAWASLLPQLKAGKVKALAITSDQRLSILPNVPTFLEEGIKLPLRGWFGYNVPSATPRPVVNRLHNEIRKVMADVTYRERVLNVLGLAGKDWSPEEFDTWVRAELKEMAELINFLDIRPE